MKFGSQLFFTTAGKAVQQIGIFALSVVFARYFTKEEYGNYLHVQLIINIATWAFVLGIPHSVYYFLPNTREKRKYVFQTFCVILGIALLTAVGLALGNDLLAQLLSNPNLPKYILFISLIAFFQIPATIFEPMMISANRVGTFVKVDFFFNLSFFFVVFIPIHFDKDLLYIFECLVVFYAVQFSFIALTLFRVALQLKNSHDEKDGASFTLAQQFKYALPIGASQGMFELGGYNDKIIISNYFTPAQYAEYTRGTMPIPFVNVVQNALDNLLMRQFITLFNANNIKGMIDLWHNAIKMMALFLYPVMVFFVLVGPLLIPALFSANYHESAIIFQIYTCVLVFRVSTYNVIVRVIGKTAILVWITLFTIVSNTAITIALVEIFGMQGAPISSVITAGLLAGAYIVAIRFYLNLNATSVFPWMALVRILFHSIISAIPAWLLMQVHVDPTQSWETWAQMGAMGVAYLITYWLQVKWLPVIPAEDRAKIREVLPARLQWVL